MNYNSNTVKNLLRQFSKRQISYHPVYRKITGSTTAGILLSQIMYWWDKMDCQEFYKTDAELMEETGLTPDEIRGAKVRLKQLKFIKIDRKGIPAKTYYDVNFELLIDEIEQTTLGENPKPVSGNSLNCIGEIPQSNTIEYTKDYTKDIDSENAKIENTKQPKKTPDKTPSPPPTKNEVVVSLPSPAASPAPATETKPPMHILDVQQQQEQSIPATPPDWMEVAKLMTEYAKGEGAQQWEYMATVQGYKGEPERILANWASKATPYQLMNWKKEFAKIQTWMRTEAVNDLKNKVVPQTGKQNIKIF